jgi:hypothetical protein
LYFKETAFCFSTETRSLFFWNFPWSGMLFILVKKREMRRCLRWWSRCGRGWKALLPLWRFSPFSFPRVGSCRPSNISEEKVLYSSPLPLWTIQLCWRMRYWGIVATPQSR